MPTRRAMLAGLGGLSAAALGGGRAGAQAPQPKTPVSFEVPRGACDCHVHVIGDPARYPMFAGRTYTPPTATADELLEHQRRLGLDRVVIVTPSTYGTDNAATLDALRQLGPERARAVVVVDDKTTPETLASMKAAGVAGLRINLEQAGVFDPAVAAKRLDTAFEIAALRDWHVQIYSRPAVLGPMAKQLGDAPVPIVFDHFGGADAALGVTQPGFDTLVGLVKFGRAYVKLSGAYRASKLAPDYPDVRPFAAALLAAGTDRLVWGSDWPHPDSAPKQGEAVKEVTPYHALDDGVLLNLLATWVPDAAVRRKILVDNPARLYGF